MKWRIVVRFADQKREPFVGSWFVSREVAEFQKKRAEDLWRADSVTVEIEEAP